MWNGKGSTFYLQATRRSVPSNLFMSDGRSVWSRIQEPTARIGARILSCAPEMAWKGRRKGSGKKEEARNEIAVEALILVRHPHSTSVRCDLKSDK